MPANIAKKASSPRIFSKFFRVKFRHPKKVKRSLAGLFVGILLTLLLLVIPDDLSLRAEHIFYDAFSQQAAINRTERSGDIYVVDIDENSLSKYGPYNEWTRDRHAKVVERLHEGGAAAIAFDILFKTADFGSRNAERTIGVLKDLHSEKSWENHYDKIRQSFDYDSVLVRTIAAEPNTIVCGSFSSRNDYKHSSQWIPLSTEAHAKEIDAKPTFAVEQATPLEKIESKDLLDNIFPELSHAAKNFGVVNATLDVDGVLRKLRMVYRFPNKEIQPGDSTRLYPSLALATLLHLFKTEPDSVRFVMGKYIDIGKPFGIYRDSSGTLRTTYPQISFPMVNEILEHANVLSKRIVKDSAAGEFLELTSQIRAVKDSAGALTIETSEGDFSPDDPDMSERDKKILDFFANDLQNLAPGQSLWLSAELDFHFNPNLRRWIPNYSILSPDVLDDLFKLEITRLRDLQVGEMVRFGKRKRIPIDGQGNFLLNFKGLYNTAVENRTFRHLSYYDVAEGRIDPALYQGKIFILGSAAPAMFDFYATPHDDHFPAVLIHATILQNVLGDDYIRAKYPNAVIYIFTAVAAILIGLFASQTLSIILLILLFALDIGVSYFFFSRGLYIGCATYLIESILAFMGSFLVRFYFENRDKTFLDKSFKQYISDKLIDEMLNSEKEPELGGEKKYLTAFFTDIQGFATISEEIGDPKKLVVLLNDYLTAMTDIIKDSHQGTLDKYEGDAIIAFFGAPSPILHQRKQAMLSALAMQKAQAVLRKNWKRDKDHKGKSLPSGISFPESVYQMHTRIGLNSGDILVGNMGSETRKNYTIIGDAVNLASRLESIGKLYGTYILVTEEVLTGAHDPEDKADYRAEFITRPIDRLKVVGRNEAVQIFELLGTAVDADADSLQTLARLWNTAQAHYFACEWEEAIAAFEKALPFEPHLLSKDPGARPTPSEVFIARCKEYQENPPVAPGEIWDGIYSATSK